LVGAAAALSLLGDQALYAVLPTQYETLGLAGIHVGILLSLNRWVRLLTNHVGYWLTHRFHPGWLLVPVLLLSAMVTASYGTWPVFWVLAIGRVLWGLCWSLIRQIGTMTSVRVARPGTFGKSVGLYNGLARVGSILGLVLGGILVGRMGFRGCFLVLGALTLLALLPGLKAKRFLRVRGHPLTNGRHVSMTWRIFVLLACGFLAGCAGHGVIFATFGSLLKQRAAGGAWLAGYSIPIAALTGVVLAIRYAIGLLGAPMLGALSDRIGHERSLLTFFLLGTLLLIGGAVTPGLWPVVFYVLGVFVCSTAVLVTLMAETGAVGPAAFARFATANDFGQAVGPLLGWALMSLVGIHSVSLLVAAVLYALGAVAALCLILRPHAPEEAAAPSRAA